MPSGSSVEASDLSHWMVSRSCASISALGPLPAIPLPLPEVSQRVCEL